MRRLITIGALAGLVALMAGSATPAAAKPPGQNGRIAFDRVTGSEHQSVFTANPDGSGEQLLVVPSDTCCPTWSPDGGKLAVPALTDDDRITFVTVNADGTDYVRHVIDDPTLNVGCNAWSPDGERCASETWDDSNPARNGVYTVRAADGGDLVPVTLNPFGGGDLPGDYSPDGSRIVFVRTAPGRRHGDRAVFVVDTDGSGLRRITPWGMAGCCTAGWSPDGKWIVLDAHGRLYLVHPGGTALHQIPLDAPGARYFASEPAWSPDGERIVFDMYVPSLGQDDIYTARADGSDLVQVTNTPEHESWPDWGTHPLTG